MRWTAGYILIDIIVLAVYTADVEVTKPAKIVLIEVMEPTKYHLNRGYEAYQNRFNGYIGFRCSHFIIG